MPAPLKEFGKKMFESDNKSFIEWEGFPFVVGQKVYGTWVDVDGETYSTSGRIVYYEQSGYWVQQRNESITPVKLFWTMRFDFDKNDNLNN